MNTKKNPKKNTKKNQQYIYIFYFYYIIYVLQNSSRFNDYNCSIHAILFYDK